MKAILLLIFAFCALEAADRKLIVIRSGESISDQGHFYNTSPQNSGYVQSDLTDAGKASISRLAKDLRSQGFRNDNIGAVFVSPLPRALQTAQILVQEGLISQDKINMDPRLIEGNAGNLEGKAIFPAWKPFVAKDHNAEEQSSVQERVRAFYQFIYSTYRKGNLIVITTEVPAQLVIQAAINVKLNLQPGQYKIVPLPGN